MNSEERKQCPVYEGFIKYFPDAVMAVANHSWKAQQKHNPDKPLAWDRSKSSDEKDAEMRHMIDIAKGHIIDEDGFNTYVAKAWRAMADLQKYTESNDWFVYTKSKVSPECAGKDCDFCDEIRNIDTSETISHEKMWKQFQEAEDKECDHCEAPYTANCTSTNQKWCLDHWKSYYKKKNAGLKSFCDTVGIPYNEVEECHDGEWDADGCSCKGCE